MQERPVSSLPQPHSLNWGPSTCTGIKLCVISCASYWLIITCTIAVCKSLGTRPSVPLNLYGILPSYSILLTVNSVISYQTTAGVT